MTIMRVLISMPNTIMIRMMIRTLIFPTAVTIGGRVLLGEPLGGNTDCRQAGTQRCGPAAR